MDFTQQLLRNHGFSFWRVGFCFGEAKKAKEDVIYEAKEIKDVEKLLERAKNGESDLPKAQKQKLAPNHAVLKGKSKCLISYTAIKINKEKW